KRTLMRCATDRRFADTPARLHERPLPGWILNLLREAARRTGDERDSPVGHESFRGALDAFDERTIRFLINRLDALLAAQAADSDAPARSGALGRTPSGATGFDGPFPRRTFRLVSGGADSGETRAALLPVVALPAVPGGSTDWLLAPVGAVVVDASSLASSG